MILAGAKLRAELLAAFGVLAFALTTVGEYSVTRTGPRARWSASPFKDIPAADLPPTNLIAISSPR
jgi:hypothetical protein